MVVRKTIRYETKYRLSYPQLSQVRNDIAVSQMQLDYYSREHSYLVRSLYFDSDDYHAYYENLSGSWGRIKLRIRSYSEEPSDNLSVELKTKFGNKSIKYSTFIPFVWYQEFMDTGHFPKNNNPVLIEFERLVYLRMLKPKVLIQYQREGFRSETSPSLRITFDSQVKSVDASDLFPAKPIFRNHRRGEVILEIKCLPKQPLWVNRCVKKHGLKWVANSKYVQSIELSRPDVVTAAADYRGMPLVSDLQLGAQTISFDKLRELKKM